MSEHEAAAVLALAMLVDAAAGEPAALYARVPHPVALVGRLVARLERALLRAGDPPGRQRLAGVVLVAAVLAVAVAAGAAAQHILLRLPLGGVWLALLASALLAQRSLVDHVRAVAEGLRRDLAAGRRAVAMIVGRDSEALDAHGVARAAVESLAENLSDGVVAPAFWFLAGGGLPGLLAYKAVNTLDSMVGHEDARHRHFGWASAKLDDLANLVPARLTALLLLAAGRGPRRAALAADWARVREWAPRHRSPNAGWPEAAMARLLGLRLAGPRAYGGDVVEDAWIGDSRAEATAGDIDRAVGLAWRAWGLLLLLAALLALLLHG